LGGNAVNCTAKGTKVRLIRGRNQGPATIFGTFGKASAVVSLPDGHSANVLLSSMDARSRLAVAAANQGVSLEWLLEELTVPEARAWLEA
jgi:hypothetical protein